MFSNNLLMAAAGGGGAGYVIENSIRLDGSSYTTHASGVTRSDIKISTFSVWVKRGNIDGTTQNIWGGEKYNTNQDQTFFNSSEQIDFFIDQTGGPNDYGYTTTAVYRDPSAWMHIYQRYDSTDATAADRIRTWINGVETTSLSKHSGGDVPLNEDNGFMQSGLDSFVGATLAGANPLDGYMAEFIFLDGNIEEVTAFGEFDDQGYWRPIDPSGVDFSGTGSLWLDFAVAPGTGNGAGTDANPSAVERQLAQSLGSTLGDLTGGSGLAASFNGTKHEAQATASTAGNVADGYIGKDWGATSKKVISKVIVYATSDAGYNNDNTASDFKISLEGSNTGAWGGEETELASVLTGNDGYTAENNAERTLTYSGSTAFRYHRVLLDAQGGVNTWPRTAEVEFFEVGNHFTDSGLTASDQVSDSPTNDADNDVGNYCTLSPLDNYGTTHYVLSNGNLQCNTTGNLWGRIQRSTMIMPDNTGKWYAECTWDSGTGNEVHIGIIDQGAELSTGKSDASSHRVYCGSTNLYSAGSDDGSPTWVMATGERLNICYDSDTNKLWFGNNGVYDGDPGAGTGEEYTVPSGNNYSFMCLQGATQQTTWEFGQNGFTDAVPTGFKALATQNMPTPAIPDPTEHHQVELVAHDGSSTAFTCNWDADTYDTLFIIKNRDSVEAFHWIDGVRGYNKYFTSETTDAWTTDSNVITVSGTTITLGSTLANDNYVVECHRAGASASRTAHTADVPPDLASTTSFNSVTGFCIMTWTGGGTLGQTINHGMGQAPDLFISSQDNASQNKRVYHSSIGATKYINLESTNGTATSSNFMNDTEPTASVISLGATGFSNNDSGASHVGYAWYSVEGNSAFGSYEGNASTDGIVVNVGIKPLSAFVKAIDSTDWWQKMETVGGVAFNGDCDALYYNSTYAETDEDANNGIDIISNGLKMRGAGGQINAAETYIYGIWGGTPIQGPAPASNTSQGRAR